MSNPTLIVLVKFRSQLPLAEVMDIINSRADEFKSLRGLQQKYYLQDETSGEFGGLYLWESKEDFTEYRESELRATIGKAYQTESEPRVEVMQVIKTLR